LEVGKTDPYIPLLVRGLCGGKLALCCGGYEMRVNAPGPRKELGLRNYEPLSGDGRFAFQSSRATQSPLAPVALCGLCTLPHLHCTHNRFLNLWLTLCNTVVIFQSSHNYTSIASLVSARLCFSLSLSLTVSFGRCLIIQERALRSPRHPSTLLPYLTRVLVCLPRIVIL